MSDAAAQPVVWASNAWKLDVSADDGIVLRLRDDSPFRVADYFNVQSKPPDGRGVLSQSIFDPPSVDQPLGTPYRAALGGYDFVIVRYKDPEHKNGVAWIERQHEEDGSQPVLLFDLKRSVILGATVGEDRVFEINAKESNFPLLIGRPLEYVITPHSPTRFVSNWRHGGEILEMIAVQRETAFTDQVIEDVEHGRAQRRIPNGAREVKEPSLWNQAKTLYITGMNMAIERERSQPFEPGGR